MYLWFKIGHCHRQPYLIIGKTLVNDLINTNLKTSDYRFHRRTKTLF